MKKNTVPKRTTFLWQVRILLVTVAIAWLCFNFSDVLPFLFFIGVAFLAFGILVSFIYIPLFFNSYKIILSNDAVIVKYGVITRVDHIMPFKRMIYAQSHQTPLARLLKISAVRLKAARSYLLIAEISEESVKKIMEFLNEGESHE